MKEVNVSNRNKNKRCPKCGKKIGDVSDKAFRVQKCRNAQKQVNSGYYCHNCGEEAYCVCDDDN